MAETNSRQLASKWTKTAALMSNQTIASHIPETRMYSKSNLLMMLNVHAMVVIKPVVGGGGHGVIKVAREQGGYSYTYKTERKSCATFNGLADALQGMQRSRRYLIQKGIQLASIQGRPIDYRVKYVKEGGRWSYRAMVGRLARKGLFVTNLCRGGEQLSASEGLRQSLAPGQVRRKKREMRKLTALSTRVLEQHFPGIGQLGFDYGIDKKGKVWIFEVNTRPS
ncbi:YheC/YheD family protein [Paenibacillus sp. IB182496]|uniref:YheC/YheD family protein n=1 Tax=Paenibacillus sabuli TaxID=2772509 RepID=A0A927BSX5_9BACL|nr:YheC/YheD family protein [Paenibacillus sabuli]MBD2845707.1 YheC/YheD family protein [Paenibacillus sabuli]